MSQEDIPRRGLLATLVGALTPEATAAASAAPGPKPKPKPRTKSPSRDTSGGLEKGALHEVADPLAGWGR